MIIDCILDRKEDDALIEQGYTHVQYPNGKTRALAYDAHKFYCDVASYGEIGWDITRAMDYGSEIDVVRALCAYVIENEYASEICDYIKSRSWIR